MRRNNSDHLRKLNKFESSVPKFMCRCIAHRIKTLLKLWITHKTVHLKKKFSIRKQSINRSDPHWFHWIITITIKWNKKQLIIHNRDQLSWNYLKSSKGKQWSKLPLTELIAYKKTGPPSAIKNKVMTLLWMWPHILVV